MPASTVSICNQAIGWVGGNIITSLDDGTDEANLCKINYDNLRNAVLESADWTFAMKRFRVAPLTEVPEYGFSKSFLLDPSILRVISVGTGNEYNDENDIDWVREENHILCNESVIYLRGIVEITDPTRFSSNFVQALAARLAADLAIPIASSRQLQSDMWALFEKKSGLAMSLDGKQGRSQRIRSSWPNNTR